MLVYPNVKTHFQKTFWREQNTEKNNPKFPKCNLNLKQGGWTSTNATKVFSNIIFSEFWLLFCFDFWLDIEEFVKLGLDWMVRRPSQRRFIGADLRRIYDVLP